MSGIGEVFGVRRRGSTIGREVLGGVTTFMAMSYILFVQVGLLGERGAGMDDGGVLMALCIASAGACILMGVIANYPIALSSGMGENFVFVNFAMIMGGWSTGYIGWQMAMALTLTAGALFLLLGTVGFRAMLLNAIPDALKSGIAAGIGLFIAVIGFNFGNIVAPGGALVTFRGFHDNPVAWLTLIGLAVTLTLLAFRIRGAILIGIVAATAAALIWGKVAWRFPMAMPSGITETAGGFVPGFAQLADAFFQSGRWLDVLIMVFILFFMDLFDTVGTLVGVASRAGLMKGGHLPRASRALAADAGGTVIGGALGASTITSYIESVTGVQSGARTGLAAIVAGLCLLAAMFFQPLVDMVMGEFFVGGAPKFPAIAPALIIVGAYMLRTIRDVDWDDVTEYLPAFLTMVSMPLAYSISDGIAVGFITYAFAKLVTGRVRQCPLIVYVFAALFVLKYALPAVS